jgi:apolipoprotein N-acyltransferase
MVKQTLSIALAGSLLMFAALPPLDLWPLAWIAPLPWLWLVRQETLPGWRPWRSLWLAGFAFWLLTLHWLRLPHPATAIGWFSLSFYLAFYVPAFVWLSRVAVHRTSVSLIVAAPVVWMGLELARAHLLTGFTMGSLGHTQYRWVQLIQISDLFGGYGVSGMVMLVAACVTRTIPLSVPDWRRPILWPAACGFAALALTLWYGHSRMSGEHTRPGPTVALIQGSIDTTVKADPNQAPRVMKEYFQGSERALLAAAAAGQKIDLMIWPETMFREPWRSFADDFQLPLEVTASKAELQARSEGLIAKACQSYDVPMLIGVDRQVYTTDGIQQYNCAVLADRDGKILDHYDKMHLVMFGEYVPFAKYLPFLKRFSPPLPSGLTPGDEPVSMYLNGVIYSPNICYETVIPHLIRRQANWVMPELFAPPDVLVNLTNDGWFWGSSELDLHLMCGVFRAVETRKPLLIAANTGFSAWIDADGRIRAQGPRRAASEIIASVELDTRQSRYLQWGDIPAGICLTACLVLAAAGLYLRKFPSLPKAVARN